MAYRLIDEEIGISELEGMVHECSSYDDSLEEYYYYENDEYFSELDIMMIWWVRYEQFALDIIITWMTMLELMSMVI